jgi:hypothetical protein
MTALRYAPHLRRLVALSGVYVAAIVLTLVAGNTGPLSTFAGFVWMALSVVLAFLDWRGLVSLGGLIRWERITGRARFWLVVVLLLLFPIAIGVFLMRALWASVREGRRVVKERPARIAKLERDLGV